MSKCCLQLFPLLLCLLHAGFAFSQPPDTVVVYEYVYKTDTVWMDPSINRDTILLDRLHSIDHATLVIDTLHEKANLVIFSSGQSATLPIDRIILSDNIQKTGSMKKRVFIGLSLIALSPITHAQTNVSDRWGVYAKGSLSTQIHSYPGADLYPAYYIALYPEASINIDNYTEEAYGKYVERNAPSLGIGIRHEHTFNKVLGMIVNSGYLQRGSRNGSSFYSKYRNRFHNLNLDIELKISTRKNSFVEPYLYGGFRGDYTFARSVKYDIDEDSNPFNESSYYGFNRFNYGFVIGSGFDIGKKYFIEFEFNNDLGYLVRNEILKVRNRMVSVNLGFYLGEAPHYKLVATE